MNNRSWTNRRYLVPALLLAPGLLGLVGGGGLAALVGLLLLDAWLFTPPGGGCVGGEVAAMLVVAFGGVVALGGLGLTVAGVVVAASQPADHSRTPLPEKHP